MTEMFNPLSANPQNGQTRSIRQQKLTNCLNVFGHFMGFTLKWLMHIGLRNNVSPICFSLV